MTNNRAIAYLDAEDQSKDAFASFRGSMLDTEKLTGRLKATLAGLFSVTAVTAGVRAIVQAASEAEQSEARLAATLRATGLSAGLTIKELERLNEQLVELTQFDDEGIRNAQATLLKFGNIQGEVFERTLRSAADLAAFMGTDLPAAAQLLGKAIQSPTEGVGALERNIGKLSAAQERVIKDLVDSGRQYEAQEELLRILQERIGGTAEAMNTGFTKATSDASKAWGDFLEELGRTDGVGGIAVGALGSITAALKAIRQEISPERYSDFGIIMNAFRGRLGAAPAAAAAAGPTPEEQAARAAAERARAAAAAEAEAAMGDRNAATIAKLREQEAKRASDERLAREKRLQEEGVRGWVQYAEAVLGEAERLDRELANIADDRSRREEQERQADLQRQIAAIDEQERIDREAGLAANGGRAAGMKELEDQTRRNKDVARELGLTFTSAFEDAVVAGESLRSVLSGIAEDIGRLVLRKGVTEPAAGFLSGFLDDLDLGKLFSGFFAEGGFIQPGTFGIVGERGPEIAFGGASGQTITPLAAGNTYVINAPGADAAALAQVERTVRELYKAVPRIARDAVAGGRARGMELG
jgi:phage-related minor tail protein